MRIKDLTGLNIHIVGLSGVEGSTITEFLWKNGIKNLTTHDFCEKKFFAANFAKFNSALNSEKRKEKIKFLRTLPITKNFKDSYLDGVENADLVFVGQAWEEYKFNFPKLKDAKNAGTTFKTIINLYLDFFPGIKIGITGSNGKSTTSALTSHILKLLGRKDKQIFLSGNERSSSQMLNNIFNASEKDILILEISNRQLKLFADSTVNYAIITNITENHLFEHADFDDYANTKFKITNNATTFLNEKDSGTLAHKNHFGNKAKDVIWFNNKGVLTELDIKRSDLHLPGEHNSENLLATLNLIQKLRQDGHVEFRKSELAEAIQSFAVISKRLELIGEKNGVKIINDLSSTTPISTIAAIKSFPNTTFSIVLGCDGKGGNYDKLVELMQTLQAAKLLQTIFILPGQIRNIIKKFDLKITEVDDFEKIAKAVSPKLGEYLIVSPAGEHVISEFLKTKSLRQNLDL